MRTFFAIDIPDEIKTTMVEIISPLKNHRQLNNLRWSKPENWHITLRFCGEITEEQYQCIIPKVSAALANTKPFTVKLTSIEPFPSTKKFRALAIKLMQITELTAAAILIDNQVITCGIPAEKRSFKPHLTIARPNKTEITHELNIDTKIAMSFEVTAIKLYKSEPSDQGSVYTELKMFELCKK